MKNTRKVISILLAVMLVLGTLQPLAVTAEGTDSVTDVGGPIPAETTPATEPTEVPQETTAPDSPPDPTEAPGESGGSDQKPSVISVDWVAPYKLQYIVNQEMLDTKGCTLTLNYDDGHQEVYNISPKNVTGFDNTILGTQTLVATWGVHEFWFEVEIIETPKPRKMYFNGWNVKNAYLQGEALDLTGGELRVYYENGNSKTIPVTDPDITVSAFDPNQIGEQIITFSYQGVTAEFYVTVCTYSGQCGDNLYFSFDEATGMLTITGSGAMYEFNYNTVPWSAYAAQILAVELPDALTELGKYAFFCCYNLNSINLPDGITSIPDHALEECRALTSLEIPDSVTHISHYAFSGAGLTSLDLPEGLESIGNYAFMSCGSLREIVLPESLKSLGGGAFYYCQNLETANIPETLDSISWCTFNECTSLQEITIPKSVTEISYWAFNSCTALNDITFEGSAPSTDLGFLGDSYPFDNVTSVAWYPGGDATWTQAAMDSMGGNLTWVGSIDPDNPLRATVINKVNVRSQPDTYATKVAELAAGTEVLIYETTVVNDIRWARIDSGWVMMNYLEVQTAPTAPDATTSGKCGENLTWAFDEDSGTLSISGSGAMYDYDWEGAPWKPHAERILKVKLPDTLSALGAYAFDGCVNLKELNLPEGIPTIPKYALNRCESLTSLIIPESVKVIGDAAFSECNSLTSLVLPEGVETVENFAFSWNSGLKKIVLPENLKNLNCGAFDNCSALESVNIPTSIGIINWSTFSGCTSLKEISIPGSVTEIAYAAFGGSGLEKVTFEGSAPYVEPHVFTPFDGVTADAWYPANDSTWTQTAMDSMGGNLTWREYDTSADPAYPIMATVKAKVNIRKEPSTYAVKLGELTAGMQVKIYEITTADGLEWARIDQGWVVKDYLEISASGEVISGICGDNLTWEFDAGTGTLTISGSGAMYDYTPGEDNAAPWYHLRQDIKNLVLSDDMTTIGDCAFWGGAGMSTVHIPEGVVSIGNFAFDICEDLVEITLPETLTHIGEYAFNYTGLKSITIPAGITVIEYGTFYLCQSLEEVVFCGDAPEFKWHNQNGNEENIFSGVTATVYYPASNPTWIPPVMQDYGGNITWCPYGEAATSGVCGDNLTWTFDKDTGTLTISGYGAMYDFDWATRPWNAFKQQILTVEMPEELTSLGENAFGGCHNLTSINLPDGITSIPDYAFGECSALSSLTIPDSVKHIGEYALEGCRSLTSLVIPDSVETVEFGAFYGCNGLREIVLPDSIKELGACAFKYCSSLETIKLSESLQIIHYNTFRECTSLKEIDIPGSVTEIAYWSFADCTSLETITFAGSAPQPAYGNDDPHFAPFRDLTADAWYAAEDPSWTDETMQRLGRDLNWIPFGTPENCIIVDSADLGGAATVWADGVEYPVAYRSGSGYIYLPDGTSKTMVVHTYHAGDPGDIHTQYPVSMKVWALSNEDGVYTAARQEAFDDILQYSGMSIRVYGKKGIRMITSMEQSKKNALTNGGLNGYTLQEYGTVIAWADQLGDSKPLVLGQSYAKSNYAYKRGVADPVFQYTGSLMQYTNVLVNFSNTQCGNDIAMRPYMILKDADGNLVTIYGGIVTRSIGYIAYQNRNVFEPGTEEYEYVWDIIHDVYGSIYDDEYRKVWTPPAM